MTSHPRTIAEAGRLLRARAMSSAELTAACFARADALDPQLGAYVNRYDETAMAAATTADRELADGKDRGPLHGIPIGIKDIIACREGVTTANSLVYDSAWWAGRDAPVVSRLREAGAVITGKLSTMEYACGLPDETKPFPLPRNPWDLATWPGGSSSGSASGVAAGFCLGALGTDTGGSIRLPAAFCGITGIKPTYGLVPKTGCLPVSPTLDHIGPMANSVADVADILSAIAGFDPQDPSTPSDRSPADYRAALNGDLSGLRIGVERTNHVGRPGGHPDADALFEAAVDVLREAGAELIEVTIPYYSEVAATMMICMQVEAFNIHRQWLAERWSDYGRGTRTVIGGGALLSAADYVQALNVRRIGKLALDRLSTEVELIVTPTTAATAIPYDDLAWDTLMDNLFTPYWDSVGMPTISVPMGFSREGLPLGLQIAGPAFDDARVLRAADAFQRLAPQHSLAPPPPRKEVVA